MNELTFDQLPKAVNQLYDKLENIERLLLEKSNEPQPEADELLDIQETALFIKKKVPTVYGLVHRAEIPVCKRGKRLYFSKQELTAWIKEGRKKTLTQTAIEADRHINKKGLNNGK